MRSKAWRVSAMGVASLCLVACGGGPAATAGSPGTGGVPSLTTESAPDPSTEPTTGTEQPQPPASGRPSILIASLPVGGGADPAQPVANTLCVHVSWILQDVAAADVPRGLAVEIQGVEFTPDLYRPSPTGCEGLGDGPACTGYIFRAGRLGCDLAVRPRLGTVSPGDSGEVRLSLRGQIYCPDYTDVTCRTFAAAVRGGPQTIPLPEPVTSTASSSGG